jgi:hypothetical protein
MGKEDDYFKLASRHASDEQWSNKERTELKNFVKKNKISQLNVNLGLAKMAVNFTQSKIKFAANHDMYQPGSYDNHYLLTGQMDPSKFDRKVDGCVNITVRDNRQWRDVSKISNLSRDRRLWGIQQLRDMARQASCGNCLEQAAVAFTFLHRLGVRPIDYYSLTPYVPMKIDHVFVVIGREYDADPASKLDPWEQWGDDAVVCDPWAPGLLKAPAAGAKTGAPFGDAFAAYPAKQLRNKVKQLFPGFTGVFLEHGES